MAKTDSTHPNYKLIGKNYPTPDLVAKVTGKAKYAEDYRAEGMLFAKLLLSPLDIYLSFCKRGLSWLTSGKIHVERSHVIRTELSGVCSLPHILQIEVWIEVFVCKVDLQLLAVDHLLCAGNLWILRFCRSQELLIGIRKRCFAHVSRFYVR